MSFCSFISLPFLNRIYFDYTELSHTMKEEETRMKLKKSKNRSKVFGKRQEKSIGPRFSRNCSMIVI